MIVANLVAGLVLLEKHANSVYHVVAEHGCIWAGPDYAGDVPKDDVEVLKQLGWLWDESVDRWLATV